MEASSLAVQEIWDQVLDHLAAHSDLKSIAKSGRGFEGPPKPLPRPQRP
jgi:hypothetical protein